MREKTAYWWSSLASNPTSSLLLLYLFLIPVQLNIFFWPPFSFLGGLRSDLLAPSFYATDLLFLFLVFVSFPRLLSLSSRIKVILIVSTIYFLSVAFLSSSPLLSLYGTLRLFQGIYLTSLIIAFLKDDVWRQRLKRTVMVSTILVLLLGMFQYLFQHSLDGVIYFLGERSFSSQTPGIANVSINGNLILRPYATFPHPNVLGGFLVTAFTYVLSLTPLYQLRKEKLTASFLFILFCSILFTFSRTAILVSVLIAAFFLTKNSRKGVVILICLSFLLMLLTLPGQHLLTTTLLEESAQKRVFLLQSAWEIFTTHPLWGVGVSRFLPSLLSFSPTLPLSFLQPVHSLFALMIVEVGVIGIIIIISLCKVFYNKIGGNIFSRLPFLFLLIGLGSMDHYLWTLHQGHMILAFILAGIFHTTGKKDQVRRSSNGNYSKRTKKRVLKTSIPQP